MMIETVPTQTGPGYTDDPFKGEENTPFFLGALIAKVTGDPDGFISTVREWHILSKAIPAGLKAKTMENVPACPPLWADESQYWDTPAMAANIIKCQWPTVVVVLSGIAAKYSGILSGIV